MHSQTEATLEKRNEIVYLPLTAQGELVRTFGGKRVILDDSITVEVINNAPVYSTFLFGTAFITMMFGMVLEGLPAAVVLIPVVFPIAERMGIHPIHFNIVQTAAVGIGLFLPPMGVGLLMALKFADLTVGQHFRTYVPYIFALLIGLTLIICVPEISLTLPRLAGLIR